MWNRFIRLQIFQYYFFWNGLLSFFSLPPTEFVNSFFPAILKMNLEISTAAGWYRKICLMVCRQQTQAQYRKYSCRGNLSILGNFYQFWTVFLPFFAIFGQFLVTSATIFSTLWSSTHFDAFLLLLQDGSLLAATINGFPLSTAKITEKRKIIEEIALADVKKVRQPIFTWCSSSNSWFSRS